MQGASHVIAIYFYQLLDQDADRLPSVCHVTCPSSCRCSPTLNFQLQRSLLSRLFACTQEVTEPSQTVLAHLGLNGTVPERCRRHHAMYGAIRLMRLTIN